MAMMHAPRRTTSTRAVTALLLGLVGCQGDDAATTGDDASAGTAATATAGSTSGASTGESEASTATTSVETTTTSATASTATATADATDTTDTTDTTTGGDLDPCGGCPEGQVCSPSDGCLACGGDPPCPDAVIYAAPDGAGEACTFTAPCLLHTAQARVRERTPTQAGDVLVFLRGGTYWLADAGPLVLDPTLDSGQNGFSVIYRAYPGEAPVLSGARPITGWTLVDPQKGIYRAPSSAPGSRHLVIDGANAVRARGPESPPGWTETATGYLAPDASMAGWAFPTELEVVGYKHWKTFRCPVAAIAGNAVTIAAQCWKNAQSHKGMGFDYTLDLPRWIENAPELLDAPGEFFRDPAGTYVDYIPRPGQDLALVDAREPVLAAIVDGQGGPGDPVHDLVFLGITFADTTWPLGQDGFSELQAGIYLGAGGLAEKMPAAVRFVAAERVRIFEATFTRLAAAGVAFGAGSKGSHVDGARFIDLGGPAVQIGDVREGWHHHPTDPSQETRGNGVRDAFITRIGRDFPGSPGLWVGYALETTLVNNDLFDLPYTGISVGWGWGSVDVGGNAGYQTPAASGMNAILDNRVAYFMRVLEDGGGIYTLGAQAGSIEHGNSIANQGNNYAGIYLDNGTQFYDVRDNVVDKVPYWLLCQTYSTNALNNVVVNNFIELSNPFTQNPHPSNTIANNVVFGGSLPPAAAAIVAASGLSPTHRAYHPDDVARGKPASASSIWAAEYAPALAVNGEGKDGWSPKSGMEDPNPWWQVDLGAPTSIARVEVVTRWDIDQPATRASLQLLGADEPTFAAPVVLAEADAAPLPHRAIWAPAIDPTVPFRYLRVQRAGGGYMFVGEVRVLAAP